MPLTDRLEEIVREENIEQLQQLLPTISTDDPDDYTDYDLVRIALIVGNGIIIDLLLNYGCRVQQPGVTDFDSSVLFYAIRLDEPDHLNSVLAKGITMRNFKHVGETPYTLIIDSCDAAARQILELYITEDFCPSNIENITPLHVACHLGFADLATKFLVMGASPNAQLSEFARRRRFSTPLHFAVEKQQRKVVEVLLAHDADVCVKNEDKRSPFFIVSCDWCEMMDTMWRAYIHKYKNEHRMEETFAWMHKKIFSAMYREYETRRTEFPINWTRTTGLHYAVARKKPEFVDFLMRNGAPVDAVDDQGFTPLHLACMVLPEVYCDGNVMWHKMDRGNNLSRVDMNKYEYAPEKMFELSKLILKRSEAINAQDKFGNTPLFYACDNVVVVSTLDGYDPNAKPNYVKDLVYLLLSFGASATVTNNNGVTPLHRLLSEEFRSNQMSTCAIVKELVERGADVDAQDVEGATPLYHAVHTVSTQVVYILLEAGANIERPSHLKMSILHMVADNPSSKETIDLMIKLLMRGVDPNERTDDGKTPLHRVVQVNYRLKLDKVNEGPGDQRIVQLVKYGADVNARDNRGRTPLHYACENLNYKATWELFQQGAWIGVYDYKGYPFLGFMTYQRMYCKRNSSAWRYAFKKYFIILREHIIKLEVLGINIDQIVKTMFLGIENFCLVMQLVPPTHDYTQRCCMEIQKMKQIKLDEHTTLMDLLRMTPPQIKSYVQNYTLGELMFAKPDFHEIFEIYGGILKFQFQKGLPLPNT